MRFLAGAGLGTPATMCVAPPFCSQATGYTEGSEVGAVQQTTTTVPVVAAVPTGQQVETTRSGEEATCAQEYFTKVGPWGRLGVQVLAGAAEGAGCLPDTLLALAASGG